MQTIYIVDDNLMMREFLKTYFMKEYDVKVFSSGEEALTFMKPNRVPDLLMLDYELEGMSGSDTMKSLKASGFYKDIPVIFLSGKQKSDIRINCLKEGAKDFILKPFNPVELSLKVKQHISTLN